ncbi:MAG: hypothetical protein P8176_14265 [Gammaproteobacteria bacterium]
MRSLVVVAVVYDGDGLSVFIRKFCRFIKGLPVEKVLVVDNGLLGQGIVSQWVRALDRGIQCEYLKGSNRFWEFSGWQEGADALRGAADENQSFLFVNDTVFSNRCFSGLVGYFFRSALEWAMQRPRVAVGEVMRTREPWVVAGRRGTRWISTYMYLLSFDVLEMINWQIFDRNLYDISVQNHEFNGPFCASFSTHLRRYLMEGGMTGWHGTRQQCGIQKLITKAGCLAAEFSLSRVIEEKAVPLVDIFDRYPLVKKLRSAQYYFFEMMILYWRKH